MGTGCARIGSLDRKNMDLNQGVAVENNARHGPFRAWGVRGACTGEPFLFFLVLVVSEWDEIAGGIIGDPLRSRRNAHPAPSLPVS